MLETCSIRSHGSHTFPSRLFRYLASPHRLPVAQCPTHMFPPTTVYATRYSRDVLRFWTHYRLLHTFPFERLNLHILSWLTPATIHLHTPIAFTHMPVPTVQQLHTPLYHQPRSRIQYIAFTSHLSSPGTPLSLPHIVTATLSLSFIYILCPHLVAAFRGGLLVRFPSCPTDHYAHGSLGSHSLPYQALQWVLPLPEACPLPLPQLEHAFDPRPLPSPPFPLHGGQALLLCLLMPSPRFLPTGSPRYMLLPYIHSRLRFAVSDALPHVHSLRPRFHTLCCGRQFLHATATGPTQRHFPFASGHQTLPRFFTWFGLVYLLGSDHTHTYKHTVMLASADVVSPHFYTSWCLPTDSSPHTGHPIHTPPQDVVGLMGIPCEPSCPCIPHCP